jgi:hypothetical protein
MNEGSEKERTDGDGKEVEGGKIKLSEGVWEGEYKGGKNKGSEVEKRTRDV